MYENFGDMGGGWGSEQGPSQGGGWSGLNEASYDPNLLNNQPGVDPDVEREMDAILAEGESFKDSIGTFIKGAFSGNLRDAVLSAFIPGYGLGSFLYRGASAVNKADEAKILAEIKAKSPGSSDAQVKAAYDNTRVAAKGLVADDAAGMGVSPEEYLNKLSNNYKNASYNDFNKKINSEGESDRKVIQAYRYLSANPNEGMEKALSELPPEMSREEGIATMALGLSHRATMGRLDLAETPEANDYTDFLQVGYNFQNAKYGGGTAPIATKNFTNNLNQLSGMSDDDLQKLSVQERLGRALFSENINDALIGAVGLTGQATGTSLPGANIATTGDNAMIDSSGIPNSIPADVRPGLSQYVTDSNRITSDYNAKADRIWNDYLDFENTYFGKSEGVQNEYQTNLNSIPKMNLTLPDTMGGATLPMAPKVHSAMYSDQANTKGNLINSQANTALAGMSSRNALNQNQFNVNQTGLTNSMLPTNTALDLYKMERAGQLGVNQAEAGKYEPSTLSTWAPVVGTLLSSNSTSGGTNLKSAWDFVSKLWS